MRPTRVMGLVSVSGSSTRMQMFFRAREASSLSTTHLKNLVMKFQGFLEAYRERCASRCLPGSWNWLEGLVKAELMERSDGIVRVGAG